MIREFLVLAVQHRGLVPHDKAAAPEGYDSDARLGGRGPGVQTSLWERLSRG